MRPLSPKRNGRAAIAAAVLALALLGEVTMTRGQEPPPADRLARAESLVQDGAFGAAAALLREILAVDPRNRRARELLAFAMESTGDRDAERLVRASLAADFPDDAGLQAAYGRALERSGRGEEALAAYRHARSLRSAPPDADLDAAIERLEGRTSVEVATPIQTMTDPDATAARTQAGAAVPIGRVGHVALSAARASAEAREGPVSATDDLLAASVVLRHPSGASLVAGPRYHAVSLQEGTLEDDAVGGVLAVQGPLGRWLSADLSGTLRGPWDEAAVAILHGGRTDGAQAHLYANLCNRRLLLQAGAQERRLSILVPEAGAIDPEAAIRPSATQSLWLAGADVVLWRKPFAASRGELLDDALVAPAAFPAAIVAGYRHYDVTTDTTPEFAGVIGLAPRGVVDEISASVGLATSRNRFGIELRGGIGRDSERDARLSRFGGSLIWTPAPPVRLSLGYEEASDLATGLTGRRSAGTFSIHVDL
jgi:tetratricopeptide (TPR) repeat protein